MSPINRFLRSLSIWSTNSPRWRGRRASSLARRYRKSSAISAWPWVLVVGGAVLLIPALVILLQAAVAGLAAADLAVGWASLIVGGGALLIGLALLAIGISRLRARRLVPSKTIERLQRDAAVATQRMRNDDGIAERAA
jgi:TRAP-type C4-dicarboxylate transport system permease small subunit